ncbi:MAG: hypothetical protein O3C21_20755, partial [Verrucomicrobia bacterium]|nr:hypothetical protein [Verrucomicrobiota bacterium]
MKKKEVYPSDRLIKPMTAPRLAILIVFLIAGVNAFAQGRLELTSPLDFQVIQRDSRESGKLVIAGSLTGVGQRGANLDLEARLSAPGHDWERV